MKRSIHFCLVISFLAFCFSAIGINSFNPSIERLTTNNGSMFSMDDDPSSYILEWFQMQGIEKRGVDILIDPNQIIYIVGYDEATYDIFLREYSRSGQLLGEEVWTSEAFAYNLKVTNNSNGDIFVWGTHFNPDSIDVLTIQYNSSGSLFQKFAFDEPADVEFEDIIVDPLNSSVYIAGTIDISSNYDAYLGKYDLNGTQLWNNTWGLTAVDEGQMVCIDAQWNIYVSGRANTAGPNAIFLLKYKADRTLIWNTTWDHGMVGDITLTEVKVINNNTHFLIGWNSPFSGSDYAFIVNFNSFGDIQWNIVEDNMRMAHESIIDSQNNLLISYRRDISYSDIYLMRYNAAGNKTWSATWGNPKWDAGLGLALDSFGNIYLTGYSDDENFRDRFLLMRFALDSDSDSMPDEWELLHSLNPFNPSDGATDGDLDGLVNSEEYYYQTDPNDADTDHDFFSDGFEVFQFGDPLDPLDPWFKILLIPVIVFCCVIALLLIYTKVIKKKIPPYLEKRKEFLQKKGEKFQSKYIRTASNVDYSCLKCGRFLAAGTKHYAVGGIKHYCTNCIKPRLSQAKQRQLDTNLLLVYLGVLLVVIAVLTTGIWLSIYVAGL